MYFIEILKAISRRENRMRISSRKITNMGLLIALSIILTRFASLRIAIGGVEGIRIGLGKLPIILGGIIFGPLIGGIIGAFSDLLGYFINPMGAYMPCFTLTSALTGIIPAAILSLTKKDEPNVLQLGAAIASGQIITSIILVPYFLHILFSLPWTILTVPRLIAEPINIIIYSYIVNIILRRNILIIESKKI
jgi:ECF transporter S component (folate family)